MNKTNNAGFSLVEISLVSFMLVAIGGAIVGLQYILGSSQLTIFNSFISVDESNLNAHLFTRELRAARSGDNGAYAIETADDFEIAFYSDVDYDDQAERVHYFLNGSGLIKETIDPVGIPVTYPNANAVVKTLSENVVNNTQPLFEYYDSSGALLATPANLSDIRLVKINLILNPRPNLPRQNYTVESFAQIRMLKDNL